MIIISIGFFRSFVCSYRNKHEEVVQFWGSPENVISVFCIKTNPFETSQKSTFLEIWWHTQRMRIKETQTAYLCGCKYRIWTVSQKSVPFYFLNNSAKNYAALIIFPTFPPIFTYNFPYFFLHLQCPLCCTHVALQYDKKHALPIWNNLPLHIKFMHSISFFKCH